MSFHADLMAAVAAVAGGRVYPGIAPEKAAYPLVNYRVLARAPITTIDSVVHAVDYTVVFECWGQTYADALTTADAVRAAIVASGLDYSPTDEPADEYEPQTDAYMEPVYYIFLYQ